MPFQLNPNAPGGAGVNKMDAYKQKLGAGTMFVAKPFLWIVGKMHGISFSMGGNTGNTFDSHRLISLAAKQGKQDAFVEEMFHSYFEKEECPSDHAVLLAVARKAGIEGAEELLAGDAEKADVNADLVAYQQRMGISGVPHFIVDGKYRESGAVDSGSFQKIFREILDSRT